MKKKICYVISEAVGAFHNLGVLKRELEYLVAQDWHVSVIVGQNQRIDQHVIPLGVRIVYVRLTREPSIFSDLIALFEILGFLAKDRPSVLCYTTPKAALLGSISGWILQIPKRVYSVGAAKFETSKGNFKRLLILFEALTCFLSTKICFMSLSLSELFQISKITNQKKCFVLGKGGRGVDFDRFNFKKFEESQKLQLKNKLGIEKTDFLIGYVGRINKDKGIHELVDGFIENLKNKNNLSLLIIGQFDSNNQISEVYKKIILEHPKIFFVSFVENIEFYYSLFDLFVFPTYREGFPNVILEAYAMHLPIISTNATGVKDALVHDLTGLLVEVGDTASLSRAISELVIDSKKRLGLAAMGYQWVVQNYDSVKILEQTEKFYYED